MSIYTMKDVDDILDRGFNDGFNTSDKAILECFKSNDEPLKAIKKDIADITVRYKNLKGQLLITTKREDRELLLKKWVKIEAEVQGYKDMLRSLYGLNVSDLKNVN